MKAGPEKLADGGRTPDPGAAADVMKRPSSLPGILVLGAILALIIASFWTLELRWRDFLAPDAGRLMAEFITGFFPPETNSQFIARLGTATLETLAMSALGTALAVVLAVVLAVPASRIPHSAWTALLRRTTRLVLNALRSIPELVWAAMWVIAAGLGPFTGTLALAAHTLGVLGRLFADTFENLPPEPARALRDNGAHPLAAWLYATLPQALPQLLSYTLYRWENNIRAAAVLGVVGAGGLGQMLYFHLSLFQMPEAASVILAMLALVGLVDAMSYAALRRLSR